MLHHNFSWHAIYCLWSHGAILKKCRLRQHGLIINADTRQVIYLSNPGHGTVVRAIYVLFDIQVSLEHMFVWTTRMLHGWLRSNQCMCSMSAAVGLALTMYLTFLSAVVYCVNLKTGHHTVLVFVAILCPHLSFDCVIWRGVQDQTLRAWRSSGTTLLAATLSLLRTIILLLAWLCEWCVFHVSWTFDFHFRWSRTAGFKMTHWLLCAAEFTLSVLYLDPGDWTLRYLRHTSHLLPSDSINNWHHDYMWYK